MRVRFHEPIDPREITDDGSLVRCHLHDEDAMAKAEAVRSPGSAK